MPQGVLATYAHHQPGAARADNPERTADVQVIGGERQGIENGQTLAVVELSAERRGALADSNAAAFAGSANLDVHRPRLGLLPKMAWRILSAGEHVVSRDRCVSDETRFGA